MADGDNSRWTYEQVLNGGTGIYYMKDDKLRYSSGVQTMQTKMNRVGYGTGTPDGKFGSGTDTAVKSFQSQNGLTSDGKAGKGTLQKLEALIGGSAGGDYSKYGKPISAADVYEGNTSISDTDWVARTIYAEQTGITEDQNAVAIEIYNRLHDTARVGEFSKKNPATLRSIVFYPSAYAVIRDKVSNLLSPNQNSAGWKNAVDRAKDLVNGNPLPSVAGISTHEFHCAYWATPPSWAKKVIQIGGSHGNIFYSY